ncbi:MAG: hypothetical protein JRD89_14525 [Deltaproteobacteria bacterium]|nr:hypothetical protein [Deltaproteobacteria bacterium]
MPIENTASDGLIKVLDFAAIQDIPLMTWMGWFFFDSVPSGSYVSLFDKTDASVIGWALLFNDGAPAHAGDQAVQFFQQASGTNGDWSTNSSFPSLSTWVHYAVSYDRTSLSNDPSIYIDGVSQSLETNINPTGTIAT